MKYLPTFEEDALSVVMAGTMVTGAVKPEKNFWAFRKLHTSRDFYKHSYFSLGIVQCPTRAVQI